MREREGKEVKICEFVGGMSAVVDIVPACWSLIG